MTSFNPISGQTPQPQIPPSSYDERLNALSFLCARDTEVEELAKIYIQLHPQGMTVEKVKREILKHLLNQAYEHDPFILTLGSTLLDKKITRLDQLSQIIALFLIIPSEDRESFAGYTLQLLKYTTNEYVLTRLLEAIQCTPKDKREFVYAYIFSELEFIVNSDLKAKDAAMSALALHISRAGKNMVAFVFCARKLSTGMQNWETRRLILDAIASIGTEPEMLQICREALPFIETADTPDLMSDLLKFTAKAWKKMSKAGELDIYTPKLLELSLYFWNELKSNRITTITSLLELDENDLAKIYQYKSTFKEYFNRCSAYLLVHLICKYSIEELPQVFSKIESRNDAHSYLSIQSLKISEDTWAEITSILKDHGFITKKTTPDQTEQMVNALNDLPRDCWGKALEMTQKLLRDLVIPEESYAETLPSILSVIDKDNILSLNYYITIGIFKDLTPNQAHDFFRAASKYTPIEVEIIVGIVDTILARYPKGAQVAFLTQLLNHSMIPKDPEKLQIEVSKLLQYRGDLTVDQAIKRLANELNFNNE